MTHLEDLVFLRGVDGIREALGFLRNLRNDMNQTYDTNLKKSVKWDGAPAMIFGTDPETGKFFVGTKSVFNKTPKVNFTEADINRNHSGELANKLKLALRYLPALNPNGIYQGDFLFDNSTITREKIRGTTYLTFRPNTITYAIPIDSDLAKEMLAAKMGIVIHTKYEGATLQTAKANFNINISRFARTKDVWYRDAYFTDTTDVAKLPIDERKTVNELLTQLGRAFNQINPRVANAIASIQKYKDLILIYNNSTIRNGKLMNGNASQHVTGLIDYVEARYRSEIDKIKTEASKVNKRKEMQEVIRWLKSNRNDLVNIFDIYEKLYNLKIILLRRLEAIENIAAFYKQPDGYKVATPEGFVAIRDENVVKIVDRLAFSRENFNAIKDWK